MVSVQLQYMLVFCKCVKVHYIQMTVYRRTQVYVYMIVFVMYALCTSVEVGSLGYLVTNLVKNFVTNLVMNLVNHRIW